MYECCFRAKFASTACARAGTPSPRQFGPVRLALHQALTEFTRRRGMGGEENSNMITEKYQRCDAKLESKNPLTPHPPTPHKSGEPLISMAECARPDLRGEGGPV